MFFKASFFWLIFFVIFFLADFGLDIGLLNFVWNFTGILFTGVEGVGVDVEVVVNVDVVVGATQEVEVVGCLLLFIRFTPLSL